MQEGDFISAPSTAPSALVNQSESTGYALQPCPSATGRTSTTDPQKTSVLRFVTQPVSGNPHPLPKPCGKKGSGEAGAHMADEGKSPKRGTACLAQEMVLPESEQLLQMQLGMVADTSARGWEAPAISGPGRASKVLLFAPVKVLIYLAYAFFPQFPVAPLHVMLWRHDPLLNPSPACSERLASLRGSGGRCLLPPQLSVHPVSTSPARAMLCTPQGSARPRTAAPQLPTALSRVLALPSG